MDREAAGGEVVTLFRISRTSAGYDDDRPRKPCDGATWMPYVRVDSRTFKSAEEHDERLAHTPMGAWMSQGRNHRTWERGICRDFDDADWFMEIPDLLAFVKQHGTCVVGPFYSNSEIMEVEIYDSWRE